MTAVQQQTQITWDIEATGLLDDTTIDYTAVPYKLKDNFKIHVICVEEWDVHHNHSKVLCFYDGPTFVFDGKPIPYALHKSTGESTLHTLQNYAPVDYEHKPLSEFKGYISSTLRAGRIKKVWGHNQINYDLLACDLVFDMPFDTDQMTWCGAKHKGFDDTFVRSKVQNADRAGGHGLDNLSKAAAAGDTSAATKYEFRPWLSGVEKFREFGPDMVYYNILDVKSNTNVARYLLKEAGDWDWAPALHLERVVAEIVTRQTHRGFFFNLKQAQSNLEFLDQALLERDGIITPLIPPKPSTKGYQKDFTPPKKQFNKDGSLSALMQKFVVKIGATLTQDTLEYKGATYPLPLDPESFAAAVAGFVEASIDDSTHIKGWLVSEHRWNPTEWKERDLSMDTKRKKLPREKVVEAIDRYVAQTLDSPFKQHRLDYLECAEDQLRNKLLSVKDGKPIRVRTNPSLTVGQEKEVDPALAELQEHFPHAKSLIEYYTYKHRRNAILGGGMEYDEDEGFAEAEKGFMSAIRADGRVPTPADTCGAATGRMKHKIVCNIPRGTSLFGGEMRGMFCVNPQEPVYQMGYDFSSLEAGMEAHFCWKYDDAEKSYCKSLLLPKPNDVHTRTAGKVSELIGKPFLRDVAKAVKYSCVPMHTKVLTKQGWKLFNDLSEGDGILSYNPVTGFIEDDIILKKHFFTDKEILEVANKFDSFQCTGDHRWYGWRRSKSRKGSKKVYGFFETQQFTQEHNLILTAPRVGNNASVLTDDECAFLGWMASDGHWKWSTKGEGTSCSFGRRKDIAASLAQADSKFWWEIEQLLDRLGVSYTKSGQPMLNGNTVNLYKIKSKWMRPFLDRVLPGRKDKHDVDWVSVVLSMSRSNLESFYNAFYLGDGRVTAGCEVITQNLGNIFDGVATAAQLLGKGRVSFSKKSNTPNPMKDIRVQKRKHITCQEVSTQPLGVQDTFCLTTQNSTFIIWQDDFIGITGNCSYGAQPPKVAKIIGSDLSTGSAVFDAFWEAAKPLALLKEDLTKQWEKTGKKYIIGLDGRKIPTRAAHSIINSLFQSGGAISAKRVMVEAWRQFKKRGWDLDFFRHNWLESAFVQQMIAMHDEAQAEVSKSLVKWKKFSTVDDAKAFKAEQKSLGIYWSEATHAREDGSVFLGYSDVTQILWDCVNKVSKDLKLKVPLAIEFVFGMNWADCH